MGSPTGGRHRGRLDDIGSGSVACLGLNRPRVAGSQKPQFAAAAVDFHQTFTRRIPRGCLTVTVGEYP